MEEGRQPDGRPAPRPAPSRRRRSTGLRRVVAAATVLLLCALSIAVTQPLWAFDGLAWLFPGIVWRVPTRAPLVALTFDDGPAPEHTPRLLDVLEAHQARATFFLVGDRAEAHPDTVAQIRAGGHEIANHYLGLGHVTGVPDHEFREKLLRTERAIGLEGSPRLFRPPGGRIRPAQVRLLQQLGYRCVLGSAYPYDAQHHPVWYIRWLTVKNLAPGVIVILHDGIPDPSHALAALPAVLEAGAERGLRFVTVGTLLEAEGPRPPTRRP